MNLTILSRCQINSSIQYLMHKVQIHSQTLYRPQTLSMRRLQRKIGKSWSGKSFFLKLLNVASVELNQCQGFGDIFEKIDIISLNHPWCQQNHDWPNHGTHVSSICFMSVYREVELAVFSTEMLSNVRIIKVFVNYFHFGNCDVIPPSTLYNIRLLQENAIPIWRADNSVYLFSNSMLFR